MSRSGSEPEKLGTSTRFPLYPLYADIEAGAPQGSLVPKAGPRFLMRGKYQIELVRRRYPRLLAN
jgi:hypothetical protein